MLPDLQTPRKVVGDVWPEAPEACADREVLLPAVRHDDQLVARLLRVADAWLARGHRGGRRGRRVGAQRRGCRRARAPGGCRGCGDACIGRKVALPSCRGRPSLTRDGHGPFARVLRGLHPDGRVVSRAARDDRRAGGAARALLPLPWWARGASRIARATCSAGPTVRAAATIDGARPTALVAVIPSSAPIAGAHEETRR